MSSGNPRGFDVPQDVLLEALEAGFWQVSTKLDRVQLSQRFLDVFGIRDVTTEPIIARIKRCVDPEDLAEITAIAKNPAALSSSFAHDIKIRRESDGEPRTLRVRGRRYIDETGTESVLGAVFDVSDSRELWAELVATRVQLEAAERIGATGSWSWNVRTGEIRWSAETFRILGVPEDTEPSFELVLAMAVDPSHRAHFERLVQAALEFDEPYDFEMPAQAVDGSVHILHTRGVVERDPAGVPIRMVGTIRDITAMRTAELELQEREARFRLLAESSPNGVFLTNAEGRATYANERLLRWFGLTFDEFSADGWMNRVHPDDLVRIMALAGTEEMRRNPFDYQYRIVVGDHERRVRIRTEPLYDVTGALRGHVGSAQDITLEYRAAAERAQLEEQLQHARRLESVGLLAGGIAHDFNNLLVGVLANVSFAREGLQADEEVTEALQDIEHAAQRAAELTRQLLSYAGRASTTRTVVNVGALAAELRGLLGARIPSSVAFHVEIGTDATHVLGDATELRQVLMNLVTNAVDAVDGTGSVQLRVTTEIVGEDVLRGFVLGAERTPGRYVSITATDTGRGMPPEVVERMFDPFFSTKGTGRGLGLAATLGMLNSHGGCVQVSSKPERGTSIRVLLPATEDTPVTPTHTKSPAALGGRAAGRLLLADDDVSARVAARRVLEHVGYTVTEVGDGQEAVASVMAQRGQWDCVLLDLTMPVMRGDAALREIRRHEPTLPVLLLSGYAEEDVSGLLDADRATRFLHKPYLGSELLDAVAALCHSRRSPGRA